MPSSSVIAGLIGRVFSERNLSTGHAGVPRQDLDVEVLANGKQVADVVFVVVRDEESADACDATGRKVGRRAVRRAVSAVEEEDSPIATYGVGAEPVIDVQDFQSHGMRPAVMGPTYQALNASLCQVPGLTLLAKFSCVT